MPLLFDATIEDNIRGGLDNVSEEEIIQASKTANCHDFIMKLPNKYQTSVGEMGTRLSGGQRQRIAIARAMLKKPSILLFDEATSALDTKSEREVQNAINDISLNKKQSIIIIAHRLSTIRDCNHILVLVNGEVDEYGNHDHLMNQNGVYAALVKQQAIVDESTQHSNLNISPN